jgi:hypothetical protein
LQARNPISQPLFRAAAALRAMPVKKKLARPPHLSKP